MELVAEALIIECNIQVAAVLRAGIGHLHGLVEGIADRASVAAEFTHGDLTLSTLFYPVVTLHKELPG